MEADRNENREKSEILPPEMDAGKIDDVLAEILPPESDARLRQVIEVMIAQSTVGPYPPPAMLREYKQIDAKIFDAIVDGARIQADHRRALELKATDGSERRLNRAASAQTLVAVLSIVSACLLVGGMEYTDHKIDWIFPCVLIAVGVGGRPVATVMTRWLTARVQSQVQDKSADK